MTCYILLKGATDPTEFPCQYDNEIPVMALDFIAGERDRIVRV